MLKGGPLNSYEGPQAQTHMKNFARLVLTLVLKEQFCHQSSSGVFQLMLPAEMLGQ